MANAVVDNTVQLYSTRINSQDRFFSIKPAFCFPDELKRQFPCDLCKDILIQPHLTVCGQRTCKTCIDERFGDNDVIPCPMSHDDFDEDELAEEQCQRNGLHRGHVVHDPGVHRRMLNRQCFCINQPFGCCATPKWRKLKEHQNICEFVPSPCPNVGCNEKFAEQHMSEHRQRCTFASSGDQGNVQETPSAGLRCDMCLKDFDDPDELWIHQRIRPQCIKEGGKCHFCDFNTSSVAELKTHMEEESALHIELIQNLISGLTKFTAKEGAVTPDAEESLLKELAYVCNSENGEATHDAHGVSIERYSELSQHKQFIKFKRLTAVYERNMYNKFFVPIWAAVMNADKSVGYVLSPKLTPLREVLRDLKESYQTSEVYYDKLNKVLRLCFAPIALAIDALHTPIYNKRTMYHHRDICIDNIYMRVRKSIDSSDQETVEYDDVKLKLTELTREVLPNDDDRITPFGKYYHHTDVKSELQPYDRKHDWYSFGVYILEVLHLTLPITIQTEFHKIQDYTDVRHVDSWIVSSSEVDAIRPFLAQYVEIAVKCLKLEPNGYGLLSYDMPEEMKQRFLEPTQKFMTCFEYCVSMWTAQLLWMYEESRPAERFGGREDDVCQACLLRSTESISTKQHVHGNQPKCDEKCQHHCLLCYTNEERLFCCNQHGTTGTIVDHRYSYALILYGQSLDDTCNKDARTAGMNLFEQEANILAKALKSKLICGLSDANIHIRPVYGNGTPEDCLKKHCEEMRELIHGDGSSSCSNDTSYILFTFYFGHSYHGRDKTVGDWCPCFTHKSDDTFEPLRLKRALIHYHTTSIQNCTNYGTSHPECQAAYLGLTYLVDPCGPSPGSTAHQWSLGKDVSISERSRPLLATPATPCYVTAWFRQMLQGLYHSECSGKPYLGDIKKRANYQTKCKVPLGKIDVCFKLARYIYEELGDAFIDGECLRIHQKHLKTHNGYTELMVQIDDEHCKPVLAYYKPQGVIWNVFSANEGEEQVTIDTGSKFTCEKIKKAVLNQIKDREQYRDKALSIVLKSAEQVEHVEVTDDNINDIAETSSLFYHVILKDDQELAKDFLKKSFETDELLGHSHSWLDRDNYQDTTFDRDIAKLEYSWSEVRDKLSSLASDYSCEELQAELAKDLSAQGGEGFSPTPSSSYIPRSRLINRQRTNPDGTQGHQPKHKRKYIPHLSWQYRAVIKSNVKFRARTPRSSILGSEVGSESGSVYSDPLCAVRRLRETDSSSSLSLPTIGRGITGGSSTSLPTLSDAERRILFKPGYKDDPSSDSLVSRDLNSLSVVKDNRNFEVMPPVISRV